MTHVTGTINAAVVPTHTGPKDPFVADAVDAGVTAVVTVGPYTNTGKSDQTVSAVVTSNAIGCTIESAQFSEGTDTPADTLVVPAGSTVSVEVKLTAASDGETAYAFDLDFTWV